MTLRNSAEYQRTFRQDAAERPFMPFTKDGEVDETAIEAARLVAAKLERYPEFVGLTYHGSSALGYSQASSDVDLNVLYDVLAARDSHDPFQNAILGMRTWRINGREVHAFRTNINVDNLKRGFEAGGQERWAAYERIAALCKAGFGKKIREYRQNIALWIATLSPEEREEILSEVPDYIVEWEANRTRKIQERMAGSDIVEAKNVTAVFESRRKLWRERVGKLLDISTS